MVKQLLIFMLPLAVACGNPSSTRDDIHSDSIYVGDSIVMTISANEYFRSIQNHVIIEDQKPYLLRENRMKNSIEVYDLQARKKAYTIPYEIEGPNTVRSFGSSAFFPFSLDSIFIANLVGDIYYTRKDSVQESFVNNKGYRFFGENSYKPVKIGNELFMHDAGNFRQTDPSFYKDFAIVRYDLERREIEAIPVEYPDRFRINCWSEHHWYVPFTANNEGHLIISFSTGPEIKVYDPETKTVVATHEPGSEFAGRVDPLPNCQTDDVDKYFRYLKSTPRYLSLIYDPFKNIYYRLIALPVPGPPSGQPYFQSVQPLSIMVLDEDFKLITERVFPGEKYDALDFYITQEGFWLSRNNEAADDFDENRIFYDLIRLENT